MGELIVFPTAEALAEQAAQYISQAAAEAIASHGRFTIALSGGSTPKGTYARLAQEPFASQIEWGKVQVFWGDERPVPPDHPDSNYRMGHQALLEHVDIPQANVHRIHGELPPAQAADLYEQTIREVFRLSGDALPRFDLVLLGLGEDGHTASLFPHSAALEEKERWVVANHVKKLESSRVTFSAPLINAAARVLFLVSGSNKATALKQVRQGEYQPEVYPAQLIKPTQGTLTWLVDAAAAGTL